MLTSSLRKNNRLSSTSRTHFWPTTPRTWTPCSSMRSTPCCKSPTQPYLSV